MDLTSQSNGNYISNSGSAGSTTSAKSILTSSPVAMHSLRVVHQKRQNYPSINPTINSTTSTSHQQLNNNNYSNSNNVINNTSYSNNSGNSNNSINGNTNLNILNNIQTAVAAAISERVPGILSDFELLSSNVQILADRYLLLKQITGSSFYECVDIRNGDQLICKAIGSSYSKILSAYFRLDGDENIKPLHKLLQASGQTYLLLPPSQYGDLHSFVRERKRLREPEARQLFRQICQTVKSCHDQGIVLRDLKLRKFVFSDSNRTQLKFESLEDAVVLDDPDDDILKEKIGCPAYVAPEILKPNSDFSGKAADLWSLGVILYTMLVGRYPFNDPEHSSLFAKISRCQFVIPDYLSSKARCLIKSLLQRVPKHRLTSDDVLYHPWFQEENTYSPPPAPSLASLSSSLMPTSSSSLGGSNFELSSDDQRVPEIDTLDFT